jgi:hypothetical protein
VPFFIAAGYPQQNKGSGGLYSNAIKEYLRFFANLSSFREAGRKNHPKY